MFLSIFNCCGSRKGKGYTPIDEHKCYGNFDEPKGYNPTDDVEDKPAQYSLRSGRSQAKSLVRRRCATDSAVPNRRDSLAGPQDHHLRARLNRRANTR
jgi:hypothetical protein